jgi:PAS domain-containing protein
VTSNRFPANESLPLGGTWPLFEHSRHFELGLVLNSAVTDAIDPGQVGSLGIHHAGCWECDLSNDVLSWSGGVHDIFGLPRHVRVTREQALSLYSEHSRASMERLRAHAIRHKRGFTLDIELRPAIGGSRWTRLIAAPVCEGDRVVRLRGLKLVI